MADEAMTTTDAGEGVDLTVGAETELETTKPDAARDKTVPLAALQESRAETKRMREQLDTVQAQLNSLANRETPGGPTEEPLKFEKDDLTTYGNVEAIIKRELKEFGKQIQGFQQTSVDRQVASAEERARKEFTAEKMGDGLDFDTVLDAFKTMIAKNPAYLQVALNSADPAKEAYELAVSLHPEIRKRVKAAENARLLEEMNKNNRGPRTPRGGGGSQAPEQVDRNTFEALVALPESELLKMAARGDTG